MKRIAVICLAISTVIPAVILRADEEVDRFILPETPPIIERVKKPPLDQPQMRKQNFITESDIALPRVVLDKNFSAFDREDYPVSVGIYQGSFGSLGGEFAFSSPSGVSIGYRADYTRGETPRLFKESNQFAYAAERQFSPSFFGSASLDVRDETVWDQRKNRYRLSAASRWFAADQVTIGGSAWYEKGEIRSWGSNESVGGTLGASVRPWDGHLLNLEIAPEHDTAFEQKDFLSSSLEYRMFLIPQLVIGAGSSVQQGEAFGRGEITWHARSKYRVSVAYRPGIEKPSWSSLYVTDRYLTPAPGLHFPRVPFSLAESFSYYRGEDDTIDLTFAQKNYAGYICWESLPGSNALTPAQLPDVYLSTMRFSMKHRGTIFSPGVEITYAAPHAMPFFPDYTLALSCDAAYGKWLVTGTLDYSSPVFLRRGSNETLPGAVALSMSLWRSLSESVDVFVAGENLLAQTIEQQPGFVQKIPVFHAGLSVRFAKK